MSTRTEYHDDVVLFSNEDNIQENDQDEAFSESELDPESLQDWHSQDLLNMYMSLVEYCETSKNFMKNITFNMFCNFILQYYK